MTPSSKSKVLSESSFCWWRFAAWIFFVAGSLGPPRSATGSEIPGGAHILWACGWFYAASIIMLHRLMRVVSLSALRIPVRYDLPFSVAKFLGFFAALIAILAAIPAQENKGVVLCAYAGWIAAGLGLLFVWGFHFVLKFRLAVVSTLQRAGRWEGQDEVRYGAVGGVLIIAFYCLAVYLGHLFRASGKDGFSFAQIFPVLVIPVLSSICTFALDPSVDGLNRPAPGRFRDGVAQLAIPFPHTRPFLARVVAFVLSKVVVPIALIAPLFVPAILPESVVLAASRWFSLPPLGTSELRVLLGILLFMALGAFLHAFLMWNAARLRGLPVRILLRKMFPIVWRTRAFRVTLLLVAGLWISTFISVWLVPQMRFHVSFGALLTAAALLHQMCPPSVLVLGHSNVSISLLLDALRWETVTLRVSSLLAPSELGFLKPEASDIYRTVRGDEWKTQVRELAEVCSLIVLDARDEPSQLVQWEVEFLFSTEHHRKTIFVADDDGDAPCIAHLSSRPGLQNQIVAFPNFRLFLRLLRAEKLDAF